MSHEKVETIQRALEAWNDGGLEIAELRAPAARTLARVQRLDLSSVLVADRLATGVELDQEGACLFTWRNGKCHEARGYVSQAEALEDAGLSE